MSIDAGLEEINITPGRFVEMVSWLKVFSPLNGSKVPLEDLFVRRPTRKLKLDRP